MHTDVGGGNVIVFDLKQTYGRGMIDKQIHLSPYTCTNDVAGS